MAVVLGKLTRTLSDGFQNTIGAADEVLLRLFRARRHKLKGASGDSDCRLLRFVDERSDCPQDGGMAPGRRPFRTSLPIAEAAVPQDLTFTAPQDKSPGQLVCVQGPHGALMVPLPDDAIPGETCKFRFGPPADYVITVPENVKSGALVSYTGRRGEALQAAVPEGKQPGDTFEVHAPVLMVRVPISARPGNEVECVAPDGQVLIVRVPPDMQPGMYFEASYQPGRKILRALAAHPQDFRFVAPEGVKPGEPVCVEGPHGPLMLPLPNDAVPGKECSIRFGPPSQYKVVVPDGASPGSIVTYKGCDGEELRTVVPPGMKPGDEFDVSPPVLMLRIPDEANPGDEMLYEAPDRRQLIIRVPQGMGPGQYFAASLEPAMAPSSIAEEALSAGREKAGPDERTQAWPREKAGPHEITQAETNEPPGLATTQDIADKEVEANIAETSEVVACTKSAVVDADEQVEANIVETSEVEVLPEIIDSTERGEAGQSEVARSGAELQPGDLLE